MIISIERERITGRVDSSSSKRMKTSALFGDSYAEDYVRNRPYGWRREREKKHFSKSDRWWSNYELVAVFFLLSLVIHQRQMLFETGCWQTPSISDLIFGETTMETREVAWGKNCFVIIFFAIFREEEKEKVRHGMRSVGCCFVFQFDRCWDLDWNWKQTNWFIVAAINLVIVIGAVVFFPSPSLSLSSRIIYSIHFRVNHVTHGRFINCFWRDFFFFFFFERKSFSLLTTRLSTNSSSLSTFFFLFSLSIHCWWARFSRQGVYWCGNGSCRGTRHSTYQFPVFKDLSRSSRSFSFLSFSFLFVCVCVQYQ